MNCTNCKNKTVDVLNKLLIKTIDVLDKLQKCRNKTLDVSDKLLIKTIDVLDKLYEIKQQMYWTISRNKTVDELDNQQK